MEALIIKKNFFIFFIFIFYFLNIYGEVSINKKDISINVKGNKTTNFSYNFNSENNMLNGLKRNDSLSLNIEGLINDSIKISGEFFQSDYELEDKYFLMLKGEKQEIQAGDITADISNSYFLKYYRNLTGIKYKGEINDIKITGFISTPKGTPHYERFLGNGTQGPFYLDFKPIVLNSEKVYLNNEILKKDVDYRIDYISGSIVLNNKILDYTDVLEITYESKDSTYDSLLSGGSIIKNYEVFSSEFDTGVAFFYENDSGRDLKDIYKATGVSPVSKVIYTIFNKIENDIFSFKGEFAHSYNKDNILEKSEMEGDAFLIDTGLYIGDFKISGDYKKASKYFFSLYGEAGDRDYEDYSITGDYDYKGILFIDGEYNYQNKLIEEIRNIVKNINTSFQLKIKNFPYLKYIYYESFEKSFNNETTSINQTIFRNTGSMGYDFLFFNLTANYQIENRNGFFGDIPSTYSKKISIYFNTYNMDFLSLKTEISYEDVFRDETTNTKSARYSVINAMVDTKISHDNIFLFETAGTWIRDGYNGEKYISDLSMFFNPFKIYKMNIKGRAETLKQIVEDKEKSGYNTNVSGNVVFSPFSVLQITYNPLWESLKLISGREINKNNQNNYTINLSPFEFLSFTGNYLEQEYFLYNTSFIELPLQMRKSIYRKNINCNISPLKFMSVKFSANEDNISEYTNDFTENKAYLITEEKHGIDIEVNNFISDALYQSLSYEYNLYSKNGGDNFMSITQTPYPVDVSMDSYYSNLEYYEHIFGGKISLKRNIFNIYVGVDYNYKTDMIYKYILHKWGQFCGVDFISKILKFNIEYKEGITSGNLNSLFYGINGNINISVNNINSGVRIVYDNYKNPDFTKTEITGNFTLNF